MILFALLVFFTSIGQCKELSLKQHPSKIKYLSKSNTFTFYQKNDGALYLASNYKVDKIFQASPLSNYQVIGGPDLYVFSIDDRLSHDFGADTTSTIVIFDKKTMKTKNIGQGLKPRAHLNNRYISFFMPQENALFIYNVLKNNSIKINVYNKTQRFFIPQIEFIDDGHILYTDLNQDNNPGLLLYQVADKKIIPLFKSEYSYQALDFSYCDKKVLISQRYSDLNSSTLSINHIENTTLKQLKTIKVTKFFLHHLSCYQDLTPLFIQESFNGSQATLAFLSKKDEITPSESDQDVFDYILMDDQIVYYQNDHYIQSEIFKK